jgi:phosphate:Na+ symporter
MTALVQSSSAVTIATIGFVNAGMLDLGRAVTVVIGSNVGTTMTSWIVALLGVKVQVGVFAAPLVGAGALLHLVARGSRRGPLGDAIAGFGLFFLGIELLRSAFEGLGGAVDLGAWALPGVAGAAIFVVIGVVLTTLTQSSSAAMALTLTAAAGGVIPLEAAAAATVGTNLGTTSTAVLAAIGATPNARRVAAAHVLFNVAAAAVALAILPLLLMAVDALQDVIGLDDTPVTLLALFHTTFNALGVALIWPWKHRMVSFLAARFRSAEEDESMPRFLDRTLLGTPDLALVALANELTHTRDLAHRMARTAVTRGFAAQRELALQRGALASLSAAVAEFTAGLARGSLPETLAELPPLALQVARDQMLVADLALELSVLRERSLGSSALADLVAVVETADAEPFQEEWVRAAQQRVETSYPSLKAQLLGAGARGELPMERLSDGLDRIRTGRRLAEHVEKGARHLALLRTTRSESPDSD